MYMYVESVDLVDLAGRHHHTILPPHGPGDVLHFFIVRTYACRHRSPVSTTQPRRSGCDIHGHFIHNGDINEAVNEQKQSIGIPS